MELEPTGERMILEHYKSSREDFVIYLLHLATYRFAEGYVRGKKVLDYGCGSGYGSAQMAAVADDVVAVDVADDAVQYAAEKFQQDNLHYQAIDPSKPLPFGDDSFDVVLSFQVFEHVRDTDRYLAEVRRVLVKGGTFILVTPDRSTRLLPGQRPWNRWHVHEYGKAELGDRIKTHFANVDVFGMGGKQEVIGIEIARCHKVKWLTLPLTLPFIPDALRVAGLNLVHKVRGTGTHSTPPREYPYTIDDIVIAEGIDPSVNLVAVAS